jgi:hypothetical protein
MRNPLRYAVILSEAQRNEESRDGNKKVSVKPQGIPHIVFFASLKKSEPALNIVDVFGMTLYFKSKASYFVY